MIQIFAITVLLSANSVPNKGPESSTSPSAGDRSAETKVSCVRTGTSEGGRRVTTDHHENLSGVFVLGVDGMDPVILDRMMNEGDMPNFEKLANEGSYQTLGTSIPPQSPVAWSNFVTGMNPGGHGIFDFVHRDPKTYHPVTSATPPIEDPSVVEIFGYMIPVDSEEPTNNRGGMPFWDLLVDKGIDVEIFRMPGSYPTPPSRAKTLSGMGTVDMRGGYGTYSWYTDKPIDRNNPKGDIQVLTIQDFDLDEIGDTAHGVLRGPPDLFHLKPGQIPKDKDYLSAHVTFEVDPEFETVLIHIGDHDILLAEGEWSSWVEVDFEALPAGLLSFSGIVRFYAKEIRPGFQIYASPVNISPANPSQSITSPDEFATELYENLGFFYTQGLPEETDALKDGTFTDDDYTSQVALMQQDTEAMLDLAIERFEPGDMTFMYVSDLDLQCHMLWRHGDPKYPDAPKHPAYDPEFSPKHAHDIENYYRNADRLLGKVRKSLPAGTLLLVMSDHGFAPYSRKVHLNAWLRDHGYLTLKEGKKTGHITAGDVDWKKTKAYALGFNGIYLNLQGREAKGSVSTQDADQMLDEIARALEDFIDPKNGARVVHKVDRSDKVYTGKRIKEAPDPIVGYDIHYGGSDKNTLGEIVEALIEDNISRWSGNHLMSNEVVPGVLLVNRKLTGQGHDLTDLTATVLRHYELEVPTNMVGKSIFAKERH